MNDEQLKKLGEWVSQQRNYAKHLGNHKPKEALAHAEHTLKTLEAFCNAPEKTRPVFIKL